MRTRILLAAIGVATAWGAAAAPDARACGGCFHEPTETGTVVTDHRMIFSISPGQTTLYDQIEYQGAPSAFAWVLPIHGPVTVGLSSDALFAAVDQATQTTIVGPPPPSCPVDPCCLTGRNFSAPPQAGAADDAGSAVTVTAHAVVGPYETVQLHSSDPTALDAWLSANGFAVPADVQPIIASYVADHFDFLALKLVPGQNVKAMRPVSVTSQGAGFSLPLRMVAAGTGASVGITLWVVGDARWEPKNFASFTIDPSTLEWDWTRGGSNYTTVRAAKEAAMGNAAWQIESSLVETVYAVESPLLYGYDPLASYAPPPGDGGLYDEGDAGLLDAGAAAALAREKDLATLFPTGKATVRITRMRADLAHAALANDLTLQGAADQSELSNTYRVTKGVNAQPCGKPVTCACDSGDDGGYPFDDNPADDTSGDDTSGGGGSAPRRASGGCSAAPVRAGGTDVDLGIAALVGIGLLRTRKPRRKPRP